MRLRLLTAALAASILSPIPIAAQEATVPAGNAQADEAPAEDFFDVVEVEIVNIDVFVTDKQGRPVTGLTRDDFAVFSDGKPVEITNFYASQDGRGETGGRRVTPADAPAAERGPSLSLAPQPAADHRLWMILYVDNYNLQALERNRVFPALRQFVGESLRPGDQAMLVTYNRKLEVVQPFTDRVSLLRDAMDELEDDAGLASVRRRDLMQALRSIDDAETSSQALFYARSYAEEQLNAARYTVDGLERLIDSLAGLPGRKALVHVSSGMPMLAGEAAFHAVAEKFGASEAYSEIPRHDATRSFEHVDRLANAHRVAFYTVDAGGLRGMEFGNAEYGGFVDPRLRSVLDSVVPENLQAPLRLMAFETGGRAIVNVNEILPLLEEAGEDFRSFYSLGIASTDSETGRYHRIEVKLRERRKDLSLRHRAGYRSKTTDTRVRESLRSALLYSHEANPLEMKVTLGRAEPQGDSATYLLPIQLDIPLRGLTLLPQGSGRHAVSLRLYVAAAGEDGGISEIDSAPLGLRLADEHVEAARGESLVHGHKLLLSPGRKRVGVAILDRFGRQTSVVTGSVLIGPGP